MQTYKTKLILKLQLTPEVIFLRFELVDPLEITFQSGQYMIVPIPGKNITRLYSIASSPDKKNTLEFIIHLMPGGIASEYFRLMSVNQEVEMKGPAGVFNLRQNEKNIIFLATGTGIVPIRSMILQHYVIAGYSPARREPKAEAISHGIASSPDERVPRNDNDGNIYLFWGVKTFQDVYLFDELKQLAEKNSNFHFQICLSRETDLLNIPENDRKYFSLGHIDKGIEVYFLELQATSYKFQDNDYYICGNPPVVESLKTKLLEKGILKENIIFEKF